MPEQQPLNPGSWQWEPHHATGIVGWRLWRWDPADRMLLPLAFSGTWGPGVNVARCHAGPPCQEPPALEHGCGFWAMREQATCLAYREEYLSWTGQPLAWAWSAWHRHHLVWGQVVLWGTVVTCEHGWRASHARVLGIAADPPATDGLAAAGFLVVPPDELC
jgi:hypothetical protein